MVNEQQPFNGPMTEKEARIAANKGLSKSTFSKNSGSNSKHLWKMKW
jgi:hypothetical protein